MDGSLDEIPACTCAHSLEQHMCGQCSVCMCAKYKRAVRPSRCRYPLRTPVTSPSSFYDASVYGGVDEAVGLAGELAAEEAMLAKVGRAVAMQRLSSALRRATLEPENTQAQEELTHVCREWIAQAG